MLRSRRISDYVEAKVSDFRAGMVVPVDVHLYFGNNRHIMIWRQNGETISAPFIEKYKKRGMNSVWIHRDDQAQWERYLDRRAQEDHAAATGVAADPGIVEVTIPAEPYFMPVTSVPHPPDPTPEPRTEQGRQIIDLLQDASLSERHRIALVAKASRQIIAAEEPAVARQVVQDVLEVVIASAEPEAKAIIPEMWKIAQIDPDLEHATNVSTYAVLFAMAFGRIDSALIADIALAGLLHDVGLSQVTASVTAIPILRQTPDQNRRYQAHVEASLELLDSFAPQIPARVRTMLQQHHEKFNGSGYPKALKGFQINDIAQLLGMADVIDTIASGQWDGSEHTIQETFAVIERVENQRSFPEFFNPEVFSAVLRWMKSANAQDTSKATEIVREKSQELIQREKLAS